MDPIVLFTLIILVFLVVGGGIFFFRNQNDEQTDTKSRLDQFVSSVDSYYDSDAFQESSNSQASSRFQNIDAALEKQGFAQGITTSLAQANLKITVTEYFILIFLSVVGTAALSHFLFHATWLLTLGGVVMGFFLPRIYIGLLKSKRLRMFNDQLGDTITLMASGLKAGYSPIQALESVGKEMPAPVSEEFQRVVQEMGLGIPSERAYNNLLKRVPSDDLELMVTAINIQAEVGGNLAEILEVISFVIRERVRIAGEVKTLTAQGIISGYVISLLPIILGLVLFAMNPEYISRMIFANDTQPCGWIMTGVGLAMILAGFIAIQKIVKIEV